MTVCMFVVLNAEEADYITGAVSPFRVIEPRALIDGTSFVLDADMLNQIDFREWFDFLAVLPQITEAEMKALLPQDDV